MSELARESVHAADLRDAWPVLSAEERVEGFRALPPGEAQDFFQSRGTHGQATILHGLPPAERLIWMRLLAPDDAADVIQETEEGERPALLALLDEPTRREVLALLAYDEDEAGGLMSPRFARLRPDMTVDEAILYLRRQIKEHPETVYYAYVLDRSQHLDGVISFRELLSAPGVRLVRDVMDRDVVSVPEDMDQEAVARLIARHDFMALPVVDATGRMKGIVTVDDIVDVVQEEATEDMQKVGGMEALDSPYLQTGVLGLLRKRAGWLSLLFVGELLTASAMARYESELQSALVLALFVPLIISSGGNSGSQATTLVIRAMALHEVRLRDWYRVIRRELLSGLGLGLILAALGLARVLLWEELFGSYGEHAGLIAATVAISLVGVVTWGTIVGSMLPFLLRRAGFDPASASAPFVATLVDVFGLVIYFRVAQVVYLDALA
jgi:magnesium transporter